MSALKKEALCAHQDNSQYVEDAPIVLSERDCVAVVNSIRYPAEPNDFLKQTMRKHQQRS